MYLYAMEPNKIIDINTPIEDILEAKLAFHDTEIAYHQQQKLMLLTFLGRHPEKANNINTISSLHGDVPKNTSVLGFEITQKNVKPHVLSLLEEDKNRRLTTAETFDLLKEKLNIPYSERKQWISAISLSYNSLTNYGKTKAIDTGNGRVKEYQYNEDES
jgi:hypothetical protein